MWPLYLGLGAFVLYVILKETKDFRTEINPHHPDYSTFTCPKPNTRILLTGDSLAVGLRIPLQQLANSCGTEISYVAKVGSHVTEWPEALKNEWPEALKNGFQYETQLKNPYDIVLISLGGNDYNRNDPENVELAIHRLIKFYREKGTHVLWIAPPPMPFMDRTGVDAMWLRQIKHSEDWFNTKLVDFPQQPDQIHPTSAGYQKLADLIWSWVSKRSYEIK